MFKRLILSLCLLSIITFNVFSQSTSSNPNPLLMQAHFDKGKELANNSEVITFSEFPLNTSITDQYKDRGIIFEGNVFISSDGANPTSPVLSGTPRFQGNIQAKFVVPGTDQPTVVKSFTIDAGYFDEFGSTRVEWFDPDGNKLGQRINSILGIETLTIEGGNIASWKFSIIEDEPAGFAVDNISFVSVDASVLFREKSGDRKDGTWGFLEDEIPGFDHVGFHIENLVYESHPGYSTGTYVSADGTEKVNIIIEGGVQAQHSRATFEHDAFEGVKTPVSDFEEIPIDEELAIKMRSAIETVSEYKFQLINYSLDGLELTLSPAAQKGKDNTFTCVGLIEWAAEQAKHNGGQGFIPNSFESMTVPDPRDISKEIEIPLLSPQLLYYAMKGQELLTETPLWVQGLFDPIDFMITDPLGRRLGFTEEDGYVNEIPNALFPGNGNIEQILIPIAIPGPYSIRFVGTGDSSLSVVNSLESSIVFFDELLVGEEDERKIFLEPTVGCMGDVNGDGKINEEDINALLPRLNRFTNGLNDPGDIDGDGLISNKDLALIEELGTILENTVPQQITQFQLLDADSREMITTFDPLQDSVTLDLSEIASTKFNLEAVTSPDTVGSVGFKINGAFNSSERENLPPYLLFDGTNGIIPEAGDHYTITATPYSEPGLQGNVGQSLTINLSFIRTQSISKFVLLDANTKEVIAGFDPLQDSVTIDLNKLDANKFNIEAVTKPGTVGSVGFEISGAFSSKERENLPPYLLFDGKKGITPEAGDSYTLIATPYSEPGLKGDPGESLMIHFSFVRNQSICKFVLLDAVTREVIEGFDPLSDSTIIDLSQIATSKFNIEAVTAPSTVGSVGFELSGSINSTERENLGPYILFDGKEGFSPKDGDSYTLIATPYSERGLKGDAGESLTINFVFVDQGNNNNSILNAFPNPSDGVIKLNGQSESEKVRIEIHCPYRGLIYQDSFLGNFQTEINLKTFGSGIYICKMINDQGEIREQTLIIK